MTPQQISEALALAKEFEVAFHKQRIPLSAYAMQSVSRALLHQTEKLAQVEAECAGYREAINNAINQIESGIRNQYFMMAKEYLADGVIKSDKGLQQLHDALQSPSGTALLARLEAAEKVVEAARKTAPFFINEPIETTAKNEEALRDALKKYDEVRYGQP